MSDRPSALSEWDSRETGDRYHVSSWVDGKVVEFQKPIPDPFVRHTITVGFSLWDRLRNLFSREMTVCVSVGGDHDAMEAVLELDANWIGGYGSRRREEHQQEMHRALGAFAEGIDPPEGDR